MPHPIVYYGTQDDDQTRSIDLVHIEPSIREGVHLVSSLYGPLASAPLYRYPPVNTFPPYLTGDAQIPNLLTCNAGQWDASPSAVLFYQWMADGADIPGANESTWMSTEEYDNTVITCEVRGWNYLGEAYALTSNQIAISLTEPIEIWEQEDYFLTGLHQGEKAQTNRHQSNMITSGISAPNRFDTQRAVAYFTTGTSADQRSDINAMNCGFVVGVSQSQTLGIYDRDIGISVISWDTGEPLVDGVPQLMNLKNPGAEIGMAGWDVFGAATYGGTYSIFNDFNQPAQAGAIWWDGGNDVDPAQANVPYSYIWQDVEIFPVWEVDVDAGGCFLTVSWHQRVQTIGNQANIRVEYYSANDTQLGFDSGPGLFSSPEGIYFYRTFTDNIPAGTRYVRIYIEWNLQVGEDNNTLVDSVSMKISKGLPNVDRSFGPNFEQWRLRFVRANTWTGGALSEIEMRNTPGTIDLCTGGSPIFGSAGLGTSNADALFDDAKNTNYWAGAENSISEGTSWVGYNFGAPQHPGEIELTARPGSDALQVPQEFYIEGSDDGIRWTPVHFVDSEMHGGDYNSAESRAILVPKGNIPYFRDAPNYNAVWGRTGGGEDNFAGKGTVFKCLSRVDISNLSVLIQDQNVQFDYTIQLCRLNTQKSGFRSIGMVTEPLEIISATSAGLNGGLTWVDHSLVNGPYEFEVDDLFLIYFFDQDAATNPEHAGEGRTVVLTSVNDFPDKLCRRVVERISPWAGTKSAMAIGDISTGGVSEGFTYSVDFNGSVF
jgi:hypothetical protein